MKITDKDRELAAELIELLDVQGDARTANLVAIILASHRTGFPDQGRCGARCPVAVQGDAPIFCELAHGHFGWHRAGQAPMTTEWSE